MPDPKTKKVHRRSSQGAFGLSLALHLLFLGCFLTISLCPSSAPTDVKKMLVSSIHLQPRSMPVAIRKSLPKAIEPVALPSSAPPAALKEPEAVEEEMPAVAQIEEKKEPAKPSDLEPSHEEVEDIQKSASKEPVAIHAKASSSKSAKTPIQSSPHKPVKKAPPAPVKKSLKSKPASSEAGSGQSKAGSIDQKLLQKVLKNLNQSKAYGEGACKGSGGSGTMRRAGTVGSLAVDRGVAVEGAQDEYSSSGYSESSPEACYIADLIRRLQLNIRLPEPGEVRLKLTLQRNGSMTAISFIRCRKESTQRTIKGKLSAMMFAPFGASFPSKSEHTFMLCLTHDLVWSCGS